MSGSPDGMTDGVIDYGRFAERPASAQAAIVRLGGADWSVFEPEQ
jgi:hypothetical protein